MPIKDKDINKTHEPNEEKDINEQQAVVPPIVEEITIEELAVDGICGIY